MSARKYRRLTSWLGLLAMWLMVCAPLVSHLVRAADADEPMAAICSLVQPGKAFAPRQNARRAQNPGQDPEQDSVRASHAGHRGAAGDQLSDCGYCNLFAGHIALPGIAPVTRFAIGPAVATVASSPPEQFTPRGDYPSGRPRGPPAPSPISS